MKQILFSLLMVTGITFAAQAQSEQYQQAMNQQVALLDSASYFTQGGTQQLANTFERIAEAEKTQWLPYYYAAYCRVNEAFLTTDKSKVDEITDKAQLNIEKASALKGKDSEISCILSLIASARIGVDPMTRGMKYGMESGQHLEEAKKLNPENPRVPMLEGQALLYTPEAFGGSKSKAKEKFEEALLKFAADKPGDKITPHWGEAYTKMLMTELSK
ncbi:hypothetical protein GFS24_21810 [Chitinophaga sp. SYP-B3965]|uniref:hypothetical protein n=1 Tax=Chitinophaga sp. SYP-B3965 TaxID=2663120 RepID=UPI001299F6D1|nr:hypothetical protein [Chitinophaga sp. SYP-B3965]MRG47775.1 hypothetical protein [Chitinophaga sp. SYP-B3965]